MSFKYQAVKHTNNHYVLPKMANMKVDAHAFLSDDLYSSSEEKMWLQLADAASYEGVTGAYLMPDGHSGFGIPIGCVIVTDDTLIQASVGYDMNCFTGDTKIPLVDGREFTLAELALKFSDSEFYVYSMTPDGHVTAGKARCPRLTKQAAELIEIRLDNDAVITCTPDHKFLLRDGSYARADSLTKGQSLMPLNRSYKDGYCDVMHPCDNSIERMYRVSYREQHGHVPVWPRVVHHDIFNEVNPNQTKSNDDPRFLVEMNQKEHFQLHASYASERVRKGEIWGGRAHKLYPEMYSSMASKNMKRLHADPAFKARLRVRGSKNLAAGRSKGKMAVADKLAGQRGRQYLLAYNKSERGRLKSMEVGLKNKGTKHGDVSCLFCRQVVKGGGGLGVHIKAKHNNHTVKSVTKRLDRQDVYCLTVDKYANFALSAGVFVHNCGILYMKVPGLNAKRVSGRYQRERWVTEVEKRIAVGVGARRPVMQGTVSRALVDDVLRYGAKALDVPAELCERQYIPVPSGVDPSSIAEAYAKAGPQLGSVGGGNHFIEMQVDRDTGDVFVMVHCGSRGYGYKTAEHFFYEGAKVRGITKNRREGSWLRIDEELGKQYWAYHNAAANFAIANRHMIAQGVNDALEEVFDVRGEVYYEISHNLVQEETLVLPDGSTKRGFVHRKGSTRAFPAGHPDLVGTAWESTGHPCLIPGSMFEGAAILFPQAEAYKSACSVNHGSGRILARGEAKRKLKHKQLHIDAEMRDVKRTFNGVQVVGIVGNSKHVPLDECAHVYKSLDKVLDVLEEEKIAKIAHRLYPVANIKGVD